MKQVVVDKDYVKIELEITGQRRRSSFSISEWTALLPTSEISDLKVLRNLDLSIPNLVSTDPGFVATWKEVVKVKRELQQGVIDRIGNRLITKLENGELNTSYNIKSKTGSIYTFWLHFNNIPVGIDDWTLVDMTDGGITITNIIIKNPDNTPKTNWRETNLKSSWKIDGIKPIEGIYEALGNDSYKYRLAVKWIKNRDTYQIIYLGGAENSIWKIGDLKAEMSKTANSRLFKARWYMADKSVNEDLVISFDREDMMKSVFSDGESTSYLKLFPTYESNSSTLERDLVSSGTAFAIGQFGYLVTNYHVVEGKSKLLVKGINGNPNDTALAEIVAYDKNNDLAILKIKEPNFEFSNPLPYTIEKKIIETGASVYALGYPLRDTMGDEVKLTDGLISAKTGFQGDISSYQTSVPVQSGNSGGPLFDGQGNVIGIVNAKHSVAENASYAIKTNYLLNLLDVIEETIETPSENVISSLSLSQQIMLIKEFVFIIEARD